MRIPGLKYIFKGAVVILLLVFFGARYISGIHSLPLESDEQDFIARSSYFDLFFFRRDMAHEDWQVFPAYDQPPLAYYIYGLGFHLAGYRDLAVKLNKKPVSL